MSATSTETININYEEILACAQSLIAFGEDILTNLLKIADEIQFLETYELFKTKIGSVNLQAAMQAVQGTFTNYQDVVNGLATFLKTVVESYQFSDESMGQAFNSWYEGVEGIISGVVTASKQTVAEGETYNFGNWVTDLQATPTYQQFSAIAKQAATDAITMIGNTSKLYSTVTGHSIYQGLSNIASYAVGAFGQLMNGATGTNTQALFNSLGINS